MMVNDGNGLMDNSGMIDSLIVDCEKAAGAIHGGHHIAFCKIMIDMVTKLTQLRAGVINDTQNLKDQVESYKQMLRDAGVEVVDMKPEEFSETMNEEGQQDE